MLGYNVASHEGLQRDQEMRDYILHERINAMADMRSLIGQRASRRRQKMG